MAGVAHDQVAGCRVGQHVDEGDELVAAVRHATMASSFSSTAAGSGSTDAKARVAARISAMAAAAATPRPMTSPMNAT